MKLWSKLLLYSALPSAQADSSAGSSSVSCTNTKCTITMADGTKFIGVVNDGMAQFRGLRYADAPTGNNRWKAPVMRDNYGGASMNLNTWGPACQANMVDSRRRWAEPQVDQRIRGTFENFWQRNDDEPAQSEDCLMVNILVPKAALQQGTKLPIVYHIHGGAFNNGSNHGTFDGLVLGQNVMVISIGYRLGIYGFLYLPEKEAGQQFQGNWGIMDQKTALQWGNKFAPHFGGDTSKATLTGCSAGSESIWWHLTTPSSWPFFNRAVSMGIGLNTAHDASAGAAMYTDMMAAANCNNMACLRNKGVNAIRNAANAAMTKSHSLKAYPSMFTPVVDGSFLTDQLVTNVANGVLRKNTPISWNYAEHDGDSFAHMSFEHLAATLPEFVAQGDAISTAMNAFAIPSDFTDQYLQILYADKWPLIQPVFGCPNKNNGNPNNCENKYGKFMTAHAWVCNTRWALNQILQSNEYGPVYPMEFQYRTCAPVNGQNTKTCHCAEAQYIIGEDGEAEIAEQIRAAYGAFFRNGAFDPDIPMLDWNALNGQTNVIDGFGLEQKNTFIQECAALDNSNYLWKKPGTVVTTASSSTQAPTTTTQAATTTTQAPVTTTTAAPTPTTLTTGPTGATTVGPTPATCPDMKWKGKKATKLFYRGKENGKMSYIVRQTILNNSNFHPNIREQPYTGFFMFSRRYCGVDFFNALSDGTISLGMYDFERTYDIKYKHTRVDGSKGSSVTFQYYQSHVGVQDVPWTKGNGNNIKKDQFFLSIDGIPDTFDTTKEADCFNLLTGVLPSGQSDDLNYAPCASTQKDAGF